MKLFFKISAIILFLLILYLSWTYIQSNPAYFSSTTNITMNTSTTSIATATTTSTITILIGGDIMLDRENRAIGETSGYDSLFAGISPLLHQADIVIANLEGSITTYPSKTLLLNNQIEKSLVFTFATTTALALKDAGLTAVNLANNHSDNFGRDGINQTHSWLESAGVEWFGDPSNIGPAGTSSLSLSLIDASSTANIICRKGICIAFVGYNEFEPGFDRILSDVKKISIEGYPVIVMPHWGDEYATTSLERDREKSRKLVAAGAFAVIGSHPHVVEDREWIGGVPVIYSIGNLIFDQYFSPEVMIGDIAELTIEAVPGDIGNGLDIPAPPSNARLDNVRFYTVSNASHKGPAVVGDPVEFLKQESL
jgi:poly-gamma-glutamate synthesis protein (capsule biosynthesis protein)